MKRKICSILILITFLFFLTGCIKDKKIEKENENLVEVENLINQIQDVTLDDQSLLNNIQEKIENLTLKEIEQIANYEKYENATKIYNQLLDQSLVDDVINKINNIGIITLDKKNEIASVRISYDLLTNDQKTKVTNYDKLINAEKEIKSLKLADSKKKLALLKKSSDKSSGVTWYMPTAYPTYINTRCHMLPYLGVPSSGSSWIVIRFNYTATKWLSWDKVTITIDGEKYFITANAELIEKGSEYGDVWETYDLTNVTSDDIVMLKKVANSKKAILRFESENNYYDYTIPSQDKTAIKQVLAAYESLQ